MTGHEQRNSRSKSSYNGLRAVVAQNPKAGFIVQRPTWPWMNFAGAHGEIDMSACCRGLSDACRIRKRSIWPEKNSSECVAS